MSEQNQDAAYQKERADKAQAELENFKKEAKDLQEFLQGEATKKEAEIRKLKEESIMKEKAFKMQKTELSQMQSQITSLKEQLQQKSANKGPDQTDTLAKAQQQNKAQKESLANLTKQIQGLQHNIVQLTKSLQQNNKEKQDIKHGKQKMQAEYKNTIQMLSNELQEKKEIIENSKKMMKQESKEITLKHSDSKANNLQRKNSKKQLNINRQIFQKQREKYEEKIRRLQEAFQKSQKSLKEYKHKLQAALEQNETIQHQLSAFDNQNFTIPLYSSSPINIKSNEEEDHHNNPKIQISCLLLTKPHYISPFLQVYEDKHLLKIYKSTRSGCFEKSMGFYRHKVNILTYEQQTLVESIVNKIIQGGQDNNHSIIIYGVKKSNKKYLMSKMLVGIKQFLLEKLQNCSENLSALYMKKSQQVQKNYVQEGNTKDSIIEVLNKVIALGYKNNDKPKEKMIVSPKKGQSKPKVRYFNIRLDNFYLQIGTSSYTNLSFREKMTTSQMLNNILFSKLPNQLQSSIGEKHLILTLNPIVDLYEECKNTLSTTFCKGDNGNKDDEDERNWKGSPMRQPVREQLNDMAKKKIQSIERQSQQTSLRIRRLEQDSFYYKTRFDELEFRLKNLLNTHVGQNTYLKKSPITLSYEKLLKFVHSVQSRNNLNGTMNQINSSYMLKSHIQAQKHNQSLDAL